MKIQEIQIKGLFGKKDIHWKLNPQVNVLVGVNGSGKSTILSIIYCMLKNIPNHNHNMVFDMSEIRFSEDKIAPIIRKNKINPQFIDINDISENIFSRIEEVFQKKFSNNQKIPLNKKEELLDDIKKTIAKDTQEIDGHKVLMVQTTEQVAGSPTVFEHFNLTMISTLNLSANAIFEFKGSNEEVLNILDLEMDKVLNQFHRKSNDEIQKKLMNALNFFLNTVQKHAEYKNHTIVYFDTDIQKELKFSDLSSGERQLVYMLIQIALNSTEKEKSSIILMDEPEISLHVKWQAHFIKQITILHPNAQFIIVTHNPAMTMNGWNDVWVHMKGITQ